MADRPHPAFLKRLAAFAAETTLDRVSAAARDRARWIIADCVPVIAAGMQVAEMKALSARQLAQAGSGNAWVLGTGKRAAPLDAALLNGTAGTWLELDEGNLFAKGHPGIQVVPAAIATAQDMGASGADLVLAVALGYELSSRIHRPSKTKLAVHPHGTYGVIGAALAVGKLKGFSAVQMLELVNVAATMAMSSSRQTLLDGATVRNIFTGHSGYMGQMAARMVECGFTGEIDAVTAVFGKILSDTGALDGDAVVAGLGEEWLIAQSYFKLHPAGRYAHSAIDALENLMAKSGRLEPSAVERIEVRAYSLCAFLSEKRVTTSFGARFSVPFALGSILYHGRSGLPAFDDAAVANPVVQALAGKVDLREDPAFTARFPDEQPVEIRIHMNDGKVHEGHCVITKGEPANPHQPADLTGKFFELGTPIWGEAVTRRLYDGLMTLERVPDFRAFGDGFVL